MNNKGLELFTNLEKDVEGIQTDNAALAESIRLMQKGKALFRQHKLMESCKKV